MLLNIPWTRSARLYSIISLRSVCTQKDGILRLSDSSPFFDIYPGEQESSHYEEDDNAQDGGSTAAKGDGGVGEDQWPEDGGEFLQNPKQAEELTTF